MIAVCIVTIVVFSLAVFFLGFVAGEQETPCTGLLTGFITLLCVGVIVLCATVLANRHGQISALSGNATYEPVRDEDGTVNWERIPSDRPKRAPATQPEARP